MTMRVESSVRARLEAPERVNALIGEHLERVGRTSG